MNLAELCSLTLIVLATLRIQEILDGIVGFVFEVILKTVGSKEVRYLGIGKEKERAGSTIRIFYRSTL